MANLLKEIGIIEGGTEYPVYIYDESAHNKIGALDSLSTTTKDNLVNALNEVLTRLNTASSELRASINTNSNNIGSLSNLSTTDKTTLVNAINEVLSSLNSNTTTINQAINELVTNIGNLDTKVNNNNPYIKLFYGKKVVIVGDSISSNQTYPPCWIVPFTQIVENNGGTVVNVASDGASILGFGNEATIIPNDGDIYVVFLGVNDYQGQFSIADIQGAVNNIQNRCVRTGTIAYYVSPIRMLSAGTTQETTGNISPLPIYRKQFERMFSNAGFKIISGLGAPSLNANTKNDYMTDGLHPVPAYKDILCNYIVQNMVYGCNTFSENTLVNTSSQATNGTGTIEMYWSSDFVDVTVSVQNCVFDGSGYVDIGKLANKTPWVTACNGLFNPTYIPSYVIDEKGEPYYLRMYEGKMQLWRINGSGTYTITLRVRIPIFFVNSYS